MSTQKIVYRPSNTSGSRTLHQVQRVLRTLIWFGLFFLLAVITGALAFFLGMMAEPLGYLLLVVGGFFTLIIPGTISRCLYVIPEFQRVVVLKMGKFVSVRGPGNFWVIPYPPFYQSVAATLDMRVQTRVITAAETLTADNVPVGCEAVIFWRVENPQQAALEVANYTEAVFQAANSALKDTVGTLELTDLLGEREMVSQKLKNIIDAAAASFGVDVSSVEITDIHVPADLIQELSVLAQSRRAAQAKIAEAEAEKAIALKLQEASEAMGSQAMEMYRLNVLERIGREEGSQIVVYGLSGQNTMMENTIAATVAGAQLPQRVPQTKVKPAVTKHLGE
ncbi:MAG: SPFH domain-containing protein [Chloroflexota bacterium]|nr:SPFH domain-containing protein [Chloroflexota bacterium]